MFSMLKGFFTGWRLRSRRTVYAAIALVLVGIAGWRMLSGGETAAETPQERHVEIARVSDLMNGAGSLSVVAQIESTSEAKISPETGGKVTRVSTSLGSFVGAGQVLVELENSSQRAALMQAEGAYEAAQAASGGNETSQESARQAGVRAWTSAHVSAAETVRTSIDGYFGVVRGSQGTTGFRLEAYGTANDLNATRTKIEAIFDRWEGENVNEANVEGQLETLATDLTTIGGLIDRIAALVPRQSLSEAYTEADRTADATKLAAARGTITGLQQSVDGARTAIENASDTGDASAEAQVKQARGAYQAALANYEKTLVRSPIAGTVNNLTVKLGDSLSPGQQIAIVSNNGALEAVAHVTEEDKERISVGQKVAVDGTEGTVTKIAPALDPVTRRIEVRIGLPRSASETLTNGQSVRVELVKDTSEAAAADAPIIIPITALKLEAERTIVFTLADGRLAAKEVTAGRLSGESVQITGGLSLEDEIVVDARGLKEGDEVSIQ